jgi:Flp pilus assembly protein TadG
VLGLVAFLRDRKGAGAVEFALVLPGLMFLLLGVINLFLVVYAQVNLHSSTEFAARKAAVYYSAHGSDATQSTVSGWASAMYFGPTISKTYTFTTNGTCGSTGSNGHKVIASGSYRVYYGFGTVNFPLSANACFP